MLSKFSVFNKDYRTPREILGHTFRSFDFKYELVKTNADNCYEIPVKEAIKNLPNITFDLKNIDYYA